MIVAKSHVKAILRPMRPVVKPIFGSARRLVRFAVRTMPSGPLRRISRRLWELIGIPLEAHNFTTRTVHGFVMHGDTRNFIDRRIYYFGFWEPNLSTWIARQLVPGDTFVDVGANIGYYSLLASQLVGPSGHVIAIEASPSIFTEMQHNLSLNEGLCNIRCLNIAVSDCEAELPLFDGPQSQTHRTSLINQEGLAFGGTINAKPLPAILTDEEFTRCRLFKIDVEGAEWLVVRGLAVALSRTRPDAQFVIEISPKRLALQGRTPGDIFEVFLAAGFNAYRIVNDYGVNSYLKRAPYQAPERLLGQVLEEADIIFSRSDSATL